MFYAINVVVSDGSFAKQSEVRNKG